ncbi:MAG: DUF1405 domain-containing protein [archaeon]|jgi:uncharacterized membrane protein YpjA
MIEFLYDKRFLFLLALINFAAGIYSLSYYLPQLNQTSPLFWIFVADCPIFALLFGINVLLLIREKPSAMLSLISIVGNFKYGLWTIFVFYLSGEMSVYWLFILSHLLLIIETIIFAKLFQFKFKHVLFAIVLFLINDFFDYVIGTHPLIFEDFLFKAALFALISSILFPIVLAILFSANSLGETQKVHKEVSKGHVKRGKWAKRL